MKSVSHSKTSEGSASQHRSHSPNNDFSEDGYSEDKVCSRGTLQIYSHHLFKFATFSLRKTAKSSWYYHWFPHKMTSEKRLQKFHTQLHDNASLFRSGQRYWLAEANFSSSMTNQKHYPDLGSNSSFLLIRNFCICFWGSVYMTPGWLLPRREFTPVPSHGFILFCLHDTTTKCHAGASHPCMSSPRFLYRGEIFIPVRNLAAVSCKREMTNHFGVKSVCQ